MRVNGEDGNGFKPPPTKTWLELSLYKTIVFIMGTGSFFVRFASKENSVLVRRPVSSHNEGQAGMNSGTRHDNTSITVYSVHAAWKQLSRIETALYTQGSTETN